MKKTVLIFVSLLFAPGTVAAIPDYQNSSLTEMEELWSHIQNGNLVVTNAIVFNKNKEFVCSTDVRGQSQFVPDFTVAAKPSFPSSVKNTSEGSCGDTEEQHIMNIANISTPIQEVQLAAGPLLFIPPVLAKTAAGAKAATAARTLWTVLSSNTTKVIGAGCVTGVVMDLTDFSLLADDSNLASELYGEVVFGAAFGWVTDAYFAPSLKYIHSSLRGLWVGSLSAVVCGNVNYILEPSQQFLENMRRRILNWTAY